MSEADQLRAKLDAILALFPEDARVAAIIDGSSLEIPDNSPRILLEAVPDGEPCAANDCREEQFVLYSGRLGNLYERYATELRFAPVDMGIRTHPVAADTLVQPVRLVQLEGQQ